MDMGFKCPRTCLGSSDLNSEQWECGLGGKHGRCGADRARVKPNRAPSQLGDSTLDLCVPTEASRAACGRLDLQMQTGHVTATLSVPTTELVQAQCSHREKDTLCIAGPGKRKLNPLPLGWLG